MKCDICGKEKPSSYLKDRLRRTDQIVVSEMVCNECRQREISERRAVEGQSVSRVRKRDARKIVKNKLQ